MPASTKNQNYQARVNTAIVRLYQSSDDLFQNSKFVERGDILQTDCVATLYDGTSRLRITDPDEYAGLWIDSNACDLIPIKIKQKKTDTNKCVSIYVTSNNPIIYKSNESQTPIISRLERGSVLICDDYAEVLCNGVKEKRYHIKEVYIGSDKTIVGYWVLSDSKIKDPLSKKVIQIQNKTKLVPLDLTAPTNQPSNKMRSVARNTNQVVGTAITVDVNSTDSYGNYIWTGDSDIQQYIEDMTSQDIAASVNPTEAAKSTGNYEVETASPSNIDYTDPTAEGENSIKYPNSVDSEVLNERSRNVQTDTNTEGSKSYSGQVNDYDNKDADDEEDEDYSYYVYNYKYDSKTMQNIRISRIGFVHGMPFQYTALTDRRAYSESINGEDDDKSDLYGRSFAQEIVSNIPIVVFAPGEPKFLSAIKEGLFGKIFNEKKNKTTGRYLKTILYESNFSGNEEESLMDFLQSGNEQYDYFTMEINTAEYYKYVNAQCRLLAKNMGLSSREMIIGNKSKTCDIVDWGKYNVDVDRQSAFDEILGLDGGVSFAYDAQSSVSDSINTTTGDSALASLLNQSSSKVREINFLMGSAAGKSFLNNSSEGFANSGPIDSVLGRIGSLVNNTISGMNVRFPEIWQDSSSSKDYSLDMKFVAPYATPFCIWRYVLVPFVHILSLAAPRSTRRVNSYVAPFLIRAFSKGYFNVEMGMITGITWKRFGDGDMISADGVPTQIDVTVDFKDLYHALTISPWKTTNLGLFFNNTGLIDLLGTLSGVNMNRISMADRLQLYGFAIDRTVKDIGTNLMRHVNDRVRNTFDKFLSTK